MESDVVSVGKQWTSRFSDTEVLIVNVVRIDIPFQLFDSVHEGGSWTHGLEHVDCEQVVEEGTCRAPFAIFFSDLAMLEIWKISSFAVETDRLYNLLVTTSHPVIVIQVGHGVSHVEDISKLSIG